MTQPGSPQSIIPVGADYLVREVTDLKRQIRELQGAVSATTTLIPAQADLEGIGFSVPTSPAIAVYTNTGNAPSLVVPVGFSRAHVKVDVHVSAFNTSAGYDFLYVGSSIQGDVASFVPNGTTPGGSVEASNSRIRLLENLVAGSFITVTCLINSGTGWSFAGSNHARLIVGVTFLR